MFTAKNTLEIAALIIYFMVEYIAVTGLVYPIVLYLACYIILTMVNVTLYGSYLSSCHFACNLILIWLPLN